MKQNEKFSIAFLDLVGGIFGIIFFIILLNVYPETVNTSFSHETRALLKDIFSRKIKPPVDWTSQVANRKSTLEQTKQDDQYNRQEPRTSRGFAPITDITELAQGSKNQDAQMSNKNTRVARMIWKFSIILHTTRLMMTIALIRGINKNIPSILLYWINYNAVVLTISIVINFLTIIVWQVNAAIIVQIILSTILTLICIKFIFDLHLEMKLEKTKELEIDKI